MGAALDTLVNANSATVAAGSGNTAPAALTQETWTVTTAANFPVCSVSNQTQIRLIDKADLGKTTGYEVFLGTVTTNGTNQTWTIIRGYEGTTPYAHGASAWTLVPEPTAGGVLNAFLAAPLMPECVAVSNIASMTGNPTVDGYTLAAGDRILLTGQSTGSQNGPWLIPVGGGAWIRPPEFASGGVLGMGRMAMVKFGTTGAGTIWALQTPTAGYTIDTSSLTWINAFAQTAFLAYIKANISPDQLLPAAANTNLGGFRQTNIGQGFGSADGAVVSQLSQGQYAYVLSGCVWTADAPASTLNGSMTAGVICIAGKPLTVAAITAHAFTASRDTYVDFADNGDGTASVTYTAVLNNSTSPALANSGSLLTTFRCAVIVSNGTNITSNASIIQGSQGASTPTAQGTTTVAAGSNGSNITATPLNVVAGANLVSTGGWATVAHSTQTYLIKYTSVSSNTLVGVTVLGGSGTVSTGDVVTQVTPLNVCDMLGNPIYPTKPFPSLVGFCSSGGSSATTQTAAVPVTAGGGFAAPFIVPPGPNREVRVTIVAAGFSSTAAAGTLLTLSGSIGNSVSGGTTAGSQQAKVAVVSEDGRPMTVQGVVSLAPGSYTAQASMTQGAAGTLTFGLGYFVSFLTVELV